MAVVTLPKTFFPQSRRQLGLLVVFKKYIQSVELSPILCKYGKYFILHVTTNKFEMSVVKIVGFTDEASWFAVQDY